MASSAPMEARVAMDRTVLRAASGSACTMVATAAVAVAVAASL